ncbi:MAG: pseudouridine synthase [Thermoguttaceae bacterium]|jgi:23S rRNA pseudouridine2605 synthase
MPPRPRPNKRRPPSRRPSPPSSSGTSEQPGERLQKILAAAGLGSRRQCEELIQTGRVEVGRQVVTELGTRVDPVQQEIRVDGVVLPRAERVYYALHKPAGVLCTNRDPSGRPRAIDMIPAKEGRLFTVGRLDMSSEGLILLTNDGELANQMTHPRYGVEKTYRVLVAGHITPETIAKLRHGVHLAEGVAKAISVRAKKTHKDATWLEMVLAEGRNREIRRLLARVGHKVLRLIRVAVGPVHLADLPAGAYRRLTREEVDALRHAVKKPGRSSKPPRRAGPPDA